MLRVERLEARETPAVSVAGGVLTVQTGNVGSQVSVSNVYSAGVPTGELRVSYDLGDGTGYKVETYTGVTGIAYTGGAGNDWYLNFTALPTTAVMGAGNDAFFGGYGREVVDLGAGNDFASIRGTSSDVTGGSGPDRFQYFWSSYNNVLRGLETTDVVFGKAPTVVN